MTALPRTRLFAVLEYLGAAPFTRARRERGADEFLLGHHRYALALLLLLVVVALLYLVGIALVTVAIMTSRELYEHYHLEGQTLSILRKFFLAWAVFYCFAMGTAALGREAYLPVVWRLTARPRVLQVSAWFWRGVIVLVLCTLSFAAYAGTKLRSDAAPGKAYFVYEDGGRFPRWLFALGFYPMARAAEQRFGPGNAVLLHVSKDALHRAFHEATFIFMGTHGVHDGILVPDGLFRVSDVQPGEANPSLQYIYMSGCDQGAGWEQALAPAHVVTFDRLTSVAEHVWWMWFTGPQTIRGLK